MDDVAKPVGSGYIAVNYTDNLRKRRPPFYFVFVKSVRLNFQCNFNVLSQTPIPRFYRHLY
jgi:hypothetical protein